MKKYIYILFIVFALILTTNNTKADSYYSIYDSKFTLLLKPTELKYFKNNQLPYIIIHSNNKVEGFGGCNKLSGTVNSDNYRLIKFSVKAITNNSCKPEYKKLENDFIAKLKLVNGFDFENDGQMVELLTNRMPVLGLKKVFVK